MAIRTQTAPKPPVDPAKYCPSMQVKHVIEMIIEDRAYKPLNLYETERETRFNDGARWQLNIILRALVELETRIEDSDTLDQLIGDMIEDAYGSMG